MTRAGRLPVRFHADIWTDEVERLQENSPARSAASRARAGIEADGLARDQLLACDAKGRDGTELPRCVKVYVPLGDRPASERPFGLVFEFTVTPTGLILRFIAFGERHPAAGARSVYERAHKRLHGRYQDE